MNIMHIFVRLDYKSNIVIISAHQIETALTRFFLHISVSRATFLPKKFKLQAIIFFQKIRSYKKEIINFI